MPETEPEPAGLGPEEYDRALVVSRVNYLLDLGNLYGRIPLSGEWTFRDVRISWHRPYRLELEIDSEIQGTGLFRFDATARGRIRISPNVSRTVFGVADVKVKTSPRPADGCKSQASARGQGTVHVYVDDVWIFPDEREVVVWINLDSKQSFPDRLTRPACGPAPKTVLKYSAWEQHFGQSHKQARSGALWGIELSGWDWKADEATFRSGGLLATLDTPERCPLKQVGCTGMTHFKLYIYPIED